MESEEHRLFPLELATMNSLNRAMLRQPLSTGCAAAETPAQAFTSAMLEIVERHAFMEWYVGDREISELIPCSEEVISLVELLARYRLSARVFLIPEPIVGHVVSMASGFRRKRIWPSSTCGIGDRDESLEGNKQSDI